MKILFGSIITSGRGKIGGQFVKRIRGGHSINNLPSSKSKFALLNNRQLTTLANIFTFWSSLTNIERTAWNNNALTYSVIDKFGNPKFLTGRQLFIKCQSQNFYNSGSLISGIGFTSLVNALTASLDFYGYDADTIHYEFNGVLSPASYYLRIDRVPNKSISPRFINSKILRKTTVHSGDIINIYNDILDKYGYVGQSSVFNVSFTFYNEYGILSAPQTFIFHFDI